MHKILLSVLALIILAGCGHEPVVTTSNVVNQEQPVKQVDVKQEEVTKETILPAEDSDGDGWVTYTNEEFGFSVEHPVEWNVNVISPQEIDGVLISISLKNNNGFNILPRGHFDHDAVPENPIISSEKISGQPARILRDSETKNISQINFTDPLPSNWNNKNRIDFWVYENHEVIHNRMLDSFQFLNN